MELWARWRFLRHYSFDVPRWRQYYLRFVRCGFPGESSESRWSKRGRAVSNSENSPAPDLFTGRPDHCLCQGDRRIRTSLDDGFEWFQSRSNHVQITHGRVLDFPNSFSTVGSTLYFRRTTWYGRGLLPSEALFEVNPSHPKRIGRIFDAIAISPDGSKLQVLVDNPGAAGDGLWVMNRDRSNRVHLGGERAHPFSPDGGLIAYFDNHALLIAKTDSVDLQPRRYLVPYGETVGIEFCLARKAIIIRHRTSGWSGKMKTLGGIYLLTLEDGKVEKIPHIE